MTNESILRSKSQIKNITKFDFKSFKFEMNIRICIEKANSGAYFLYLGRTYIRGLYDVRVT